MLLSTTNTSSGLCSVSLFSSKANTSPHQSSLIKLPARSNGIMVKNLKCFADSRKSDHEDHTTPGNNTEPKKPSRKSRLKKPEISQNNTENSEEKSFPPMIPRKPRRGRKSEAAAVEDYVRGSLQRTFDSIREQNPEIVKNMENIMKKKKSETSSSYEDDESEDDDDDEDEGSDSEEGRKMLIEEEDPNWPLDADIGWGIRASEYFDQHPIKNVLGEDGVEIDWEGEIDNGLVKEINCLEWESFAFHPSPLVVLVFERYNRASDNWKVLKELEKAAEVYWKAKDRLPPRTVKIDMNIERDLAYALKVRECPQILFLRGNKILYREKDTRSSDELVQMIAYFYYNAKKPSCINDDALTSPRMRG